MKGGGSENGRGEGGVRGNIIFRKSIFKLERKQVIVYWYKFSPVKALS